MNIPKHWQLVKLGDICLSSQYGYTTSAAEKGDIRLVRTTDIAGKSQVDWLNVPFAKIKPDNLEDFLLENGDILISRSGTVGVSSLVSAIPYKAIFASYLIRFKPVIIDSEYLYYFTKTENYWQQISDNKSGNTISNVNATKLSNLDIPIPPLAEQKRIVKTLSIKLSEYQKDFDSAKNELAKMAEYRKSILEEAITGKLSERWRIENKENSNLILDQVKKLRNEWISNELINNNSEAKRLENKLNQHNYIKPNKQLPNNWIFSSILDCSHFIIDSINKTPKYSNRGFLVIRTSNIKNGKVILNSAKYVNEVVYKIWISRVEPQEGDIIFTREAPIGEAAVFPKELKACLGQRTMLFRFFKETVDSRFIMYYMLSDEFKRQIENISIGSGVQHLRVGDVEKLIVVLPPLTEQLFIANEVENLNVKANEIVNEHTKNIDFIKNLQQSILQMAFNGNLSSPNPNDEPVTVLLEKVKKEKVKLEEEHTEIQKSKSKIRSKMNKKIDGQSISEILHTVDTKTLTVEELWEETIFVKTNEVEPFYEELLQLEKSGKITISFADEEKKLRTNIILVENAH